MERDILFAIGEICTDVSYGNITAEEAIDKIREKYLDFVFAEKNEETRKLNVGDTFWEYNRLLHAGYKRIAHTDEHIKYFLVGYNKRAFFTKEELLEAHPDASVQDEVKERKITYACLD